MVSNGLGTLVQQLIGSEESKTQEFKRDASSLRPIITTVVAFANSAGGYIVIGVDDDKNIVGVTDPLSDEERIASALTDSITPMIVPEITIATVEQKSVLVIRVFPSTRRPHFITSKGMQDGTYVRIGSTNRKSDENLTEELAYQAKRIHFDGLALYGDTLDALDLSLAENLLQRPIDVTQCLSLGLAVKEQDKVYPTNAGMLLFGKNRQRDFPFSYVQLARIRTNDAGRPVFIDNLELWDPLPLLPDLVTDFLRKHAFLRGEVTGLRRTDSLTIPLDSLRELVVNALVHASYMASGASFKIAFYDTHIDIESPGLLLSGVTVDNIADGVSRVRNPAIVRIFKELGYIEQWGTGLPTVLNDMKNRGLPGITFKELSHQFRVRMYILDHGPGGSASTTSVRDHGAGGSTSTTSVRDHGAGGSTSTTSVRDQKNSLPKPATDSSTPPREILDNQLSQPKDKELAAVTAFPVEGMSQVTLQHGDSAFPVEGISQASRQHADSAFPVEDVSQDFPQHGDSVYPVEGISQTSRQHADNVFPVEDMPDHSNTVLGGIYIDNTDRVTQLSQHSNAARLLQDLGSRLKEMLAFAQEPVTKKELFAEIQLAVDSRNTRRYIDPLLETGLLALTIPNKPTSPNQRYVTTKHGLAILKSIDT